MSDVITVTTPQSGLKAAGTIRDSAFDTIKKNQFVLAANQPHPLATIKERIDALYSLGENWNGGDVAAPNSTSIEKAKTWIGFLYDEITNAGYEWKAPHVTANESGSVVFEWLFAGKRWVVYVTPDETFYLKAWGPSIASEMSDGDAAKAEERLSCWIWLVGQRDTA